MCRQERDRAGHDLRGREGDVHLGGHRAPGGAETDARPVDRLPGERTTPGTLWRRHVGFGGYAAMAAIGTGRVSCATGCPGRARARPLASNARALFVAARGDCGELGPACGGSYGAHPQAPCCVTDMGPKPQISRNVGKISCPTHPKAWGLAIRNPMRVAAHRRDSSPLSVGANETETRRRRCER